MKKNNIDYATRLKDGWKEVHFAHRYGVYGEHLTRLGALRIPICSERKEVQFINTITQTLAEIYHLRPPKQSRK